MTAGKLPLSVYVHLPFCNKKCPYCHFYVTAYREDLELQLVSAIIREWNLKLLLTPSIEIVSIYFGGGTPSLVSASSLKQLIDALGPYASNSPEITIEANPESLTAEQCRSWKQMGINRVSIGAQSFIDKELIMLGREHSVSSTIKAVHTVYDHGIDNISIDLMYEQPSQSLRDWSQSLEIVPTLPIEHLSLYNLTIEPHTGFYRKKDRLKLPSEEEGLAMLTTAMRVMKNNGFHHYEISAFCKTRPSIHNTGYWMGRAFWGLGPSAFSFINQERIQNTPNIHQYLKDILKNDTLSESFREKLAPEASIKELLIIQLRLRKGVDLNQFTNTWGTLPSDTLATIDALVDEGLLHTDATIKLTDQGLYFFDSIASRLV